jgi:Zn-dependent membrane protease YugP
MFFFDWTIIILIPGIIIAAIAQGMVSSSFNKYSKIKNSRNMTGAEAAKRILNKNHLENVRVERVSGKLTDHYDPKRQVLRLSESVYDNTSISAIGVAAHEVGHAIQDKKSYVPLKIRSAIVPVVNIASTAAFPLFLIGFFIGGSRGLTDIGFALMNIGIIFFIGVLFFYLITLPVEINASSRAINELENNGLINDADKKGVKKVLQAAAFTYIASALTALLNLVRLIILRNSRS